jgi:hypothetical protein
MHAGVRRAVTADAEAKIRWSPRAMAPNIFEMQTCNEQNADVIKVLALMSADTLPSRSGTPAACVRRRPMPEGVTAVSIASPHAGDQTWWWRRSPDESHLQ